MNEEKERQFMLHAYRSRNKLLRYVMELNNIPTTTEIPRDLDEIRNMSDLGWFDLPMKCEHVDSPIFRRRYLSNVIIPLASNIHIIADTIYRMSHAMRKKEDPNLKLLMSTVDRIEDNIISFGEAFLVSNDWLDQIEPIMNYSWMIRLKKRGVSMMSGDIFPYIDELRDGTYRTMFTKPPMEEGVIVDHIFRITLILCGGQPYDNIPRGPRYESFVDKVPGKDSYQKEIENIGSTIRMIQTQNRGKRGLLFEAYMESYPEVGFYFNGVVRNRRLYDGCMALYFVRMIVNDKYVSEYIDLLLGKKRKLFW